MNVQCKSIRQLLEAQRAFSVRAFGYHSITTGVHAHLLEEIKEVRHDPEDLTEWADCLILALDGAHRTDAPLDYIAIRINEILKQPGATLSHINTLDKFEGVVTKASEEDLSNVNTWCYYAVAIIRIMEKQTTFFSPELYAAVELKQAANNARDWGDHSEQDPSKPINHKRTPEEELRKQQEERLMRLPSHDWNHGDGEGDTCVKCGDKDYNADPYCHEYKLPESERTHVDPEALKALESKQEDNAKPQTETMAQYHDPNI
ncbi:protein of unknown function DUF550 [Vibrio phage D4]|nr:protein of unknown function DUF550 [Vibrio phage D4]